MTLRIQNSSLPSFQTPEQPPALKNEFHRAVYEATDPDSSTKEWVEKEALEFYDFQELCKYYDNNKFTLSDAAIKLVESIRPKNDIYISDRVRHDQFDAVLGHKKTEIAGAAKQARQRFHIVESLRQIAYFVNESDWQGYKGFISKYTKSPEKLFSDPGAQKQAYSILNKFYGSGRDIHYTPEQILEWFGPEPQ